MKFAAAHWLWFLVLMPLAYGLALWDEKRRQQRLSAFVDRALWPEIVPELNPGARLRKSRFWIFAMAFALLALARPQWGTHEEVAHVSGLDIMIVLDVSSSMEVEDVMPSRLKKAKHLIRTLVQGLNGDRVGVIPFAASSYVACPLTTDLEYVLEIVEGLGPNSIVNQGTDIGLGFETAQASLIRGSEEGAAAPNGKVASQAVILISDGEDHEERAVEMATKFKNSGIGLYVVGVGTEKGGPIPLRDANGALHEYKKNAKGEGIVSSFKPSALMQLAAIANGHYWNATLAEGEIEEILNNLSGLSRNDYAERRYVVYEDRFQYPLALAFILFILELAVPMRRKTAKLAGALGVLLAVMQVGCVSPLDNYRENEKGIQAFKEGKLDEAKQNFGSVQAKDPSSPELLYNQGVVQAQEGDVENAIRNFSEAAKGALERGDQKLAGPTLFNLGAAFAKKGDVNGALQSYLGAIDAARKTKDTALEQDAKKNIELLLQQIQQQKQQQQDKKENDKKESDKKDQGKKENEKKDEDKKDSKEQDREKKEKQNQPKKYEDPSGKKKKFNSKKLSDEDAERVMAELKNQERELQAKRKNKNVRPQNNRQDW